MSFREGGCIKHDGPVEVTNHPYGCSLSRGLGGCIALQFMKSMFLEWMWRSCETPKQNIAESDVEMEVGPSDLSFFQQ